MRQETPNISLSYFSVGHLLLGIRFTRKSGYPSDAPVEKTDVQFASGYQLEMVSLTFFLPLLPRGSLNPKERELIATCYLGLHVPRRLTRCTFIF